MFIAFAFAFLFFLPSNCFLCYLFHFSSISLFKESVVPFELPTVLGALDAASDEIKVCSPVIFLGVLLHLAG
jgi:hypothetical protein